jgi:hypothetical protein
MPNEEDQRAVEVSKKGKTGKKKEVKKVKRPSSVAAGGMNKRRSSQGVKLQGAGDLSKINQTSL